MTACAAFLNLDALQSCLSNRQDVSDLRHAQPQQPTGHTEVTITAARGPHPQHIAWTPSSLLFSLSFVGADLGSFLDKMFVSFLNGPPTAPDSSTWLDPPGRDFVTLAEREGDHVGKGIRMYSLGIPVF